MTNNVFRYKEFWGFVFFILILAVLFLKVTWLFRGNSVESREDIQGYYNEQCGIDVILFDGSDVLRFYDPLDAWNKYGYTSYNYAVSSAQADMLRFYAEESRKTQNAELYVFDLRTISFVTDVISEPTLRNWSDSISPFSCIRARGIYSYIFNRDKSEIDIPSYFIDIINYHTKYDALSDENQWSYMNTKNIRNVDKGFEPYINHTPFGRPVITEERENLSSNQIKALSDLVNYCRKEDLNVLFICSPIVINEEEQKVMNSVSDFIEASGYEFIDFNKYYDDIGIDFETDYGDVNHVNYLGAIKFTDYFTKLLNERYDLPDHRNDMSYIMWDDDYEEMSDKRTEWMLSVQENLDYHLKAKKNGEILNNIDDFSKWYEYIKNPNYSVVLMIKEMPKNITEDNPLMTLLYDYEIDLSQKHYMGVWKGDNAIYSSVDDEVAEVKIGVDSGQGKDTCQLLSELGVINIEGVEYSSDESKIQVVIYDNNYKKVIDYVNLIIERADSVILNR